ncbi:TPA: hypothetical protein ACGO9Z_002184 [Streptococcus suis]|nr:hypothetical protein [Streptococcus suis]MDY3824456.1 hypothetical protein [Streptococcus sp.]UUM57292.1 hypothetical protein NQZ91_07880 [Streptococcus suis]UUM62934.1 hypothetical protein NQZ89_05315 [Streptococcus suis]WNF83626.1 hypothetical protein RJW52_07585 [Streptococcus suis]
MQEWIVVDQFGNLYAGPFLGPEGKRYAEEYVKSLYGNYRVELKK